MRRSKRHEEECRISVPLLMAALVIMILWAVCGSCTRMIPYPVETVRTEYKDNIREIRTTDSVTDTRFVYVKGDTVIDYRDRVKWREKQVHDSVYIHLTDTISVPVPVEKKLTRWQQTKIDYGGEAILALVIIVCVAVIWLIKKFRK